jgi:hypothetical protein
MKGQRVPGIKLSNPSTKNVLNPTLVRKETAADKPGVGVLIDTEIVGGSELVKTHPYFITVDGYRYYGSTPEDVVENARNNGSSDHTADLGLSKGPYSDIDTNLFGGPAAPKTKVTYTAKQIKNAKARTAGKKRGASVRAGRAAKVNTENVNISGLFSAAEDNAEEAANARGAYKANLFGVAAPPKTKVKYTAKQLKNAKARTAGKKRGASVRAGRGAKANTGNVNISGFFSSAEAEVDAAANARARSRKAAADAKAAGDAAKAAAAAVQAATTARAKQQALQKQAAQEAAAKAAQKMAAKAAADAARAEEALATAEALRAEEAAKAAAASKLKTTMGAAAKEAAAKGAAKIAARAAANAATKAAADAAAAQKQAKASANAKAAGDAAAKAKAAAARAQVASNAAARAKINPARTYANAVKQGLPD